LHGRDQGVPGSHRNGRVLSLAAPTLRDQKRREEVGGGPKPRDADALAFEASEGGDPRMIGHNECLSRHTVENDDGLDILTLRLEIDRMIVETDHPVYPPRQHLIFSRNASTLVVQCDVNPRLFEVA